MRTWTTLASMACALIGTTAHAAPIAHEDHVSFAPSDADLYGFQWHHHRQHSWLAWERSPNHGANVKIAVLDTGVAPVSTLPNVALDEGANFIDPGASALDDHGHGTHMASIIASQGDLWGVAPGATIVPVKVLDEHKVGTEAALIEGLYFAAGVPDVAIISMSLTFPPGYRPSKALVDAIDHVAASGIVMVAAAGNDGVDEVAYPARFPQVIAVGAARLEATDDGLEPVVADYSNRGGAVDVVAFGGDLSQDLDDDGVPDGILGESLPSMEAPSGLVLIAGTSPAAAQVAGAAALLIDAGVERSEIRQRLQRTARRLGADGLTHGESLVQLGAAMPEGHDDYRVDLPAAADAGAPADHWGLAEVAERDARAAAAEHMAFGATTATEPPAEAGAASLGDAPAVDEATPAPPELRHMGAAPGCTGGGALPPPWLWLFAMALVGLRRRC